MSGESSSSGGGGFLTFSLAAAVVVMGATLYQRATDVNEFWDERNVDVKAAVEVLREMQMDNAEYYRSQQDRWRQIGVIAPGDAPIPGWKRIGQPLGEPQPEPEPEE